MDFRFLSCCPSNFELKHSKQVQHYISLELNWLLQVPFFFLDLLKMNASTQVYLNQHCFLQKVLLHQLRHGIASAIAAFSAIIVTTKSAIVITIKMLCLNSRIFFDSNLVYYCQNLRSCYYLGFVNSS